ncbi:DUF6401 family natural product biosynthesis protein [Nocardia sp. NPDC127526]|uniref:DUF6401 family natural product biosynthesis protein n=1 Tax=Nocardia sp. NPDC127526 TaxID=3345393 RepID=UPI00363ACDB2
MFSSGSALLIVSARKTLNRLQQTHGVPAQAAAREFPAVSAELDQHAAAVRDILDMGVENSAALPPSVLLAGYARGLLEDADETETPAPESLPDWQDADWVHLRLASLCLLAREG